MAEQMQESDGASSRLEMIQKLVAQPPPEIDPTPSAVGKGLFVGSKHHAADVQQLIDFGITAVLNCAPGCVRSLPLATYREKCIEYICTDVKRDDLSYPIVYHEDGSCSKHLQTAVDVYARVLKAGGQALFCCVAGQNRSATLAVAVLLLKAERLDKILTRCSESRPFILENKFFQRQLVRLEANIQTEDLTRELKDQSCKTAGVSIKSPDDNGIARITPAATPREGHEASIAAEVATVAMAAKVACGEESEAGNMSEANMISDSVIWAEVCVPGLWAVFDVALPAQASISTVKQLLVEQVDCYLSKEKSARVGKSWLVYHGDGETTEQCQGGTLSDLILEATAVELGLLLERLQKAFGLQLAAPHADAVCWSSRPQFELVVFSLMVKQPGMEEEVQEPFVFCHKERPGALGTLLVNQLVDAHVRAWDFGSGKSFRSLKTVVFSFADDPRQRRDFRDVSVVPSTQCQKFETPREGDVLGMGANAIVHRVPLEEADTMPFSEARPRRPWSAKASMPESSMMKRPAFKHLKSDLPVESHRDAAVKRSFSLAKMLGMLERKSEAGMAMRLRMAHSLNPHGRLLYSYGLGIVLSSHESCREEYRFEAALFSKYDEEFESYTLKNFLEDYTSRLDLGVVPDARIAEVTTLQENFSLISVKVLLVSLLNGFRDLTLMGIQAFDFNHLDNVLISRDYKQARLIDIDGESKGSIQFPSEYIDGKFEGVAGHHPHLDVELSQFLPIIVQRLMLGKGRGLTFVDQTVHSARRKSAKSDEEAKKVLSSAIRENFFPEMSAEDPGLDHHLLKVVDWFYRCLMKKDPWATWTNDLYDSMRCIDHLPIT